MPSEKAGEGYRQAKDDRKGGRMREVLSWLLFWPTFWVGVVALGAICVLCLTFEQRAARWVRGAPEFSQTLVHSANFWVGLGALGTIFTLFFIYQQIAGARNVSAYQFLRELDDRFRSPEMRRRRSGLAKVLLTNPENYELVGQHGEEICGYFEDLGLLLRKGIAPKYLIWSMFDYRILRYWQLLSPYIRNYRVQKQDRTYYNDFEYLWKRIARFEKNILRRNNVDADRSDLDQFLHNELRVDLRRFRLSDLGRVMEIERSSFDVDAYSEDQFQELYNKDPGGFRVAEIANFVVGYIAATVLGEVGEIDSMAVHPDYRRLRIGRRLMEFALSYLGVQYPGLKLYRLQVRTNNLGAIRLYEQLGFRTTDTLKGYYRDHADAFEMEMAAGRPASAEPERQAPKSDSLPLPEQPKSTPPL